LLAKLVLKESRNSRFESESIVVCVTV